MYNMLITSVGRRTYLINYFKEALANNGFVHASNSEMTYTLLQADKYVLTPQIYNDDYISFLLNYCEKESINAIISLFDIDLPILSKNKALFKSRGIEVVVSSLDVINICNDKWKTYNYIKELGLHQPTSFISLDHVFSCINDNKMSFPIILKPRWGMGSIGLCEAENIDELLFLYKKLKKDIFKTYLKFESKEDEDSCIILQEKVFGREYGLDIFNDLNGCNVAVIPKEKLAMRAGETDVARIDYNSDMVNIGKIIAGSLRHICNLDLDCFLAPDGTIVVLEMNARFGGQYPFSHLAGANFPMQIISWLNGGETDPILLNAQNDTVACKELIPKIMNNEKR